LVTIFLKNGLKIKLVILELQPMEPILLTFSKVKNIDPEIARDFENASDRNMSSNIVWLTAPQEKTYNLTINITF
jgi:hypothetical protein